MWWASRLQNRLMNIKIKIICLCFTNHWKWKTKKILWKKLVDSGFVNSCIEQADFKTYCWKSKSSVSVSPPLKCKVYLHCKRIFPWAWFISNQLKSDAFWEQWEPERFLLIYLKVLRSRLPQLLLSFNNEFS